MKMRAFMKTVVSLTLCLLMTMTNVPVWAAATTKEADKDIIVDSGVYVVEEDEVISGNIYVRERASLHVHGRVLGTIYVQTSDFCDLMETEDGTLVTPENLWIDPSAVINKLEIEGKCRVSIHGEIHTVTLRRGSLPDVYFAPDASVEVLNNFGTQDDVWIECNVDHVNVTAGTVCVAAGGYVRTAEASGGRYVNNGVTDFLSISGNATGLNWLAKGEKSGENGRIQFLLLEGDSCTDAGMEVAEVFDNFGVIDNLISLGSSVSTFGAIHHAWVKGGRLNIFSQDPNSHAEDVTETYSIDELTTIGTYIYNNSVHNTSTPKYVKEATIIGGECNFDACLFDKLTIQTLSNIVLIGRDSVIRDLTIIDAGDMTDKSIWLEDRNAGAIKKLHVSSEFEQYGYLGILEALGMATGEEMYEDLGLDGEEYDIQEEREKYYAEQLEIARKNNMYDVVAGSQRNPLKRYRLGIGQGAFQDRKNAATPNGVILNGYGEPDASAGDVSGNVFGGVKVKLDASAEVWMSFDVEANAIYSLELTADQSSAYAILVMPDGSTMSGAAGGNASSSIITYQSGKGYLAVLGAENGATVKVNKGPIRKFVPNFTLGEIDSVSGELVSVPADDSDIVFRLYDETAGCMFRKFKRTRDGVFFTTDVTGHRMTLMANHRNNEKYTPGSASFTVSDAGEIRADLMITEYGRYAGSVSDAGDVRIYLYDENGHYLQSILPDAGWFASEHLEEGNYKAVFIRDEKGDNCFERLSDYERFGFENHSDYVLDSVSIENGKETRYYNVEVPKIRKRENHYLNEKDTFVKTNVTTVIPGSFVTVTFHYALDSADADRAEAVFTLLEHTMLEGTYAVVDGEKIPIREENGMIRIPVGDKLQGKISLCISADEGVTRMGTLVQMDFVKNDKTYSEFVGNASADIVTLTFLAPDNTAEETVYVHGKTTPYAEVLIFDGNTQIGSAYANAAGNYGMNVSLAGGLDVYEHTLYAVVNNEGGDALTSASVTVKRNLWTPTLDQFVMRYYIHSKETVLSMSGKDFIEKDFIYFYWPDSVFSFEITLSNADAVKSVSIGSDSNGVKKEIKATYDERLGCWIASGKFSDDENYIPEHFYISYSTKGGVVTNSSSSTAKSDAEKFRDYFESDEYKNAFAQPAKVTDLDLIDNDTELRDISLIENTEMGFQCLVDTKVDFSTTPLSEEDLFAAGYTKIEEDGTYYVKIYFSDEGGSFYVHKIGINDDPSLKSYFEKNNTVEPVYPFMSREDKVNAPGHNSSVNGQMQRNAIEDGEVASTVVGGFGWYGVLVGGLIENETLIDKVEIGNEIIEQFDDYLGYSKMIVGGYDAYLQSKMYDYMQEEIQNKADFLRGLLEEVDKKQKENPGKTCFPNMGDLGGLIDQYEKDGIAAAQEATKAAWRKYCLETALDLSVSKLTKLQKVARSKAIGKFLPKLGDSKFDKAIGKGITGGVEFVLDGSVGLLVDKTKEMYEKFMDKLGPSNDVDQSAQNLDDLLQAVNKKLEDCNCPAGTDCGGGGDGGDDGGTGNIGGNGTGIEDPSGFVYAGIESERLSDVTCTLYYKDESGEAILWNAYDYDQINPQITDATGGYFWMVPRGEWKVVCEAQGYETYETEWLEVPPPQTEVNINLKSLYAPKIKDVYVQTDSAIISFDMYVDQKSVLESNIKLTDENGKNISFTIEPYFENEDSRNETLAKQFKLFFRKSSLKEKSKCNLYVPATIKGYNDKMMEKDLTAQYEVLQKISKFSSDCPECLVVGRETAITIHIDAQNAQNISVYADVNGEMIQIVRDGGIGNPIAFDQAGNATITLKALREGQTKLDLHIVGYGMSVSYMIYCGSEEQIEAMKPPVTKEEPAKQPSVKMVVGIVIGSVAAIAIIALTVVLIRRKKRSK